MSITQSRLHTLLLAAEQYQQLYDSTVEQARRESAGVARRVQTLEQAYTNIVISLLNARPPTAALATIATERVYYNLTASRNTRTRERKERQRRGAGIAQRPMRQFPDQPEPWRDAPLDLAQLRDADGRDGAEIVRQLDLEEPNDGLGTDFDGPVAGDGDVLRDQLAGGAGNQQSPAPIFAPGYKTLTAERKAELDREVLETVRKIEREEQLKRLQSEQETDK